MLRFLATSIILVAARAIDAYTTWIATRDLALESNPLISVFHLGWRAVLLVNAVVVGVFIVAAWRAAFAAPILPVEPGLDLEEFVGRFWFRDRGRRTLSQAMIWLPSDRRVRWAFLGGSGAFVIIAARVVLGCWNLLVARAVVGPIAGRIWLLAFWVAVAALLALSVRIFLRREYARYLADRHTLLA